MGLGKLARHLVKVRVSGKFAGGKNLGSNLYLVTGSVKHAERSVSLPKMSILGHPQGSM